MLHPMVDNQHDSKIYHNQWVQLLTGVSIDDIKQVASMVKYKKPPSQLLAPVLNMFKNETCTKTKHA